MAFDSSSDPKVEVVECHRFELDDDFAGTRFRNRSGLKVKCFRATVCLDHDPGHILG